MFGLYISKTKSNQLRGGKVKYSMEMGLDLDNVKAICDCEECQNCHIDCELRNNDNVTRNRPPFM